VVSSSVNTESLEGGEENEDGCPAVVQGEGKVDPQFVVQVLTSVVLLDNVINVGDRGTNQERKNKGDNVVFVAPDVNVDSVENGQERKAPADTVNDDTLASREELVDDETKEE